jgi:hypothetical protein
MSKLLVTGGRGSSPGGPGFTDGLGSDQKRIEGEFEAFETSTEKVEREKSWLNAPHAEERSQRQDDVFKWTYRTLV